MAGEFEVVTFFIRLFDGVAGAGAGAAVEGGRFDGVGGCEGEEGECVEEGGGEEEGAHGRCSDFGEWGGRWWILICLFGWWGCNCGNLATFMGWWNNLYFATPSASARTVTEGLVRKVSEITW